MLEALKGTSAWIIALGGSAYIGIEAFIEYLQRKDANGSGGTAM